MFWKEGKTARTDTVYFSGTNDLNGIRQREPDSLYLVPLIRGSHPYDSSIHAPGLGYRMEFSIKTIGSMWHAEDSVELVPTYYYMERDGSSLRQVNLYRKDDLQEFYLPVSLKAEDRTITAEGMQTWRGSYQIPADVYIVNAGVDLADYVAQKKGRIKQKDPVFLRDGYLIVYFPFSRSKKEIHILTMKTDKMSTMDTVICGKQKDTRQCVWIRKDTSFHFRRAWCLCSTRRKICTRITQVSAHIKDIFSVSLS